VLRTSPLLYGAGLQWIDSSSVGSTNSYTAGNGLSLVGNQFKLGGAITEATRLNIGNTEVMYISTTGNIGLGTTSPVGLLNISSTPSSTANYGLISIGTGNWSGTGNDFDSGDADGTFIALNAPDNTRSYLDFQRVGNPIFKINQSGYVGIGNANPIVALDVVGAKDSAVPSPVSPTRIRHQRFQSYRHVCQWF
jgi:hypothetical protein